MKLVQTEISPTINSMFSVLERKGCYFVAPFHFHPEMELVYIVESHGKRIIGDSIQPFAAGDMFFIGSNLPHVWLNDEIYYQGDESLHARAIVLYFNKNLFSENFYSTKEAIKMQEFFKRAEGGFSISGHTNKIVARRLEALLQKSDFDLVIHILEIIRILSESKDLELLTSEGYFAQHKFSETDRLSEAYKYVQQNFREHINLATIAKISNLTPQSFCRLFKKRNGKNFVEYLNEVRVSAACKYLLDKEWTVSEIAYHCGYKTVSNFNKLFKKITGVSPKVYRLKSR